MGRTDHTRDPRDLRWPAIDPVRLVEFRVRREDFRSSGLPARIIGLAENLLQIALQQCRNVVSHRQSP